MGRTKAKYKTTYEQFRIHGVFEALVVDVYDGDTCTCIIDPFPDSQYSKDYWFKVRLMGIDTPEMKPHSAPDGTAYTPEQRDAIKVLAKKARTILRKYVLGKTIMLQVHDTHDKYGRLLANLYSCDGELSYNEMLCDTMYALPYAGGTKYDWVNEI